MYKDVILNNKQNINKNIINFTNEIKIYEIIIVYTVFTNNLKLWEILLFIYILFHSKY